MDNVKKICAVARNIGKTAFPILPKQVEPGAECVVVDVLDFAERELAENISDWKKLQYSYQDHENSSFEETVG